MRLKRRLIYVLILSLLAVLFSPFSTALAGKGDSPYRVEVDLVNQIVTVFTNDDNDDIVMQCLCSSGANDATPTGTFKMPQKKRPTERTEWFHFRAFGGYARYATRIYMDVMFHSLLYSRPRESRINEQSVKDFGYPVSHGCIRLRVEDAKFIAENCPVGTRVKIHKENERDEDLRNLLYQSSFYASAGKSYSSFLGIPDEPGILGKGSSGDEVRDLQLKLKDLGIYTDDIDGKYTLATVRAVREAQSLLGVEQTGMATLQFQEAIAQPDTPSAMNVKLKQGSSGPAVRALQRNLKTLKLYNGDIDGVYDIDVIDAVKTFQNAYGFEINGVAKPIVQKAAYYEAGYVQGLFAGQDDYSVNIDSVTRYLGRVNCEVGIKLRKEPTTESESLMSLKKDTTVIGVEYGSKWSKVMKNGVTGYVMNSYMEYRSEPTLTLYYMGSDGQVAYTLGVTDTNDSPAERFKDYIEGGGSLEKYDNLAEFATTQANLELRATPADSGDSVASVPQGTDMSVVLKSGDWALVEYNGVQGYAHSEQLEFWLAPEDDDEDDDVVIDVYENDVTETATITPREGSAAPVYESGDESTKVLGDLPSGTQVNVIETVDGWSLIELKGHQGYVKEMDLKFTTT